MIWQFGEIGYDYSINTCSNGVTLSTDCRLSEKPIRWDYTEEVNRKILYNLYSKLIQLKKNHDVFSNGNMQYSLAGAQKYVIWKSTKLNAFVIGNFDVVSSGPFTLTLPKTGTWYSIMDDATIHVASLNYTVNLQPGEYLLYSDTKINPETKMETESEETGVPTIFPNPVESKLNIYSADPVRFLTIFSLDGRIIKQNCNSESMDLSFLNAGLYFVRVATEKKISLIKFIKK